MCLLKRLHRAQHRMLPCTPHAPCGWIDQRLHRRLRALLVRIEEQDAPWSRARVEIVVELASGVPRLAKGVDVISHLDGPLSAAGRELP
jgi:hypothetical protein